jgi:hypothetical protein
VTREFRSTHNCLAFFAIVLLLGPCLRANAADMKVAVAKVDITPPVGTRMWGYFDRLKGAEGTSTPSKLECKSWKRNANASLMLTSIWAVPLDRLHSCTHAQSPNATAK